MNWETDSSERRVRQTHTEMPTLHRISQGPHSALVSGSLPGTHWIPVLGFHRFLSILLTNCLLLLKALWVEFLMGRHSQPRVLMNTHLLFMRLWARHQGSNVDQAWFYTQGNLSTGEKINSVINNYDTGRKRKPTRDVRSKLFEGLEGCGTCRTSRVSPSLNSAP